MKCLWLVYACILIVCCYFPMIDSNKECTEEGEDFEYQEEGDQGQANQGKPSTCFTSESYHGTMHYSTLTLTTMHCFSYIANYP
jgi:hypothetical protein